MQVEFNTLGKNETWNLVKNLNFENSKSSYRNFPSTSENQNGKLLKAQNCDSNLNTNTTICNDFIKTFKN